MHAWNKYMIMHKDRTVASIKSDGTAVIHYASFMPYNLYLEANTDDLDARINNLNNFYYWCSSRMLSLDRKYAKEILNSLQKKQAVTDRDRAEIVLSYHGLCLTDVYWVRRERSKDRFEDLNLYENSLSNAFVDVSLRGKQLTAQNRELMKESDVAGDVSTAGVSAKAWVRKDGEFYLYKDGEKKDVAAELLASRIARCFAVKQVLYEPGEYAGRPVSVSRIMTSPERSIVPMEAVEIYAVNQGIDWEKFVQERDEYSYCMMNIIDYLVGNTDRHWGNWGFCVENAANQLQGLHPLMDLNKSFTSYNTTEGGWCQTTRQRMSQKEAAIAAVRRVGLNQVSEISPDWFSNKKTCGMFFRRLEILREAEEKNRT